jgi:hypothetical protein
MSEEDDKTLFDDRETILDKVEDMRKDSGSLRPVRDKFEDATDKIPEGPLGKAGDGDIVGAAGYYAISTGQVAVLPIPGVKQPGYSTVSHGVEAKKNYERHTIRINAASEQVARVAAEYEVAAPSNIDYLTAEIDTVESNEIKSRSTFSTWEFIIDVADRGSKEN